MASYPRCSQTPFRPPSNSSIAAGGTGSTAPSRSQGARSNRHPASFLSTLQPSDGRRQTRTPSIRAGAAGKVSPSSVSSIYRSSPPLLARAHRPELSLRSPCAGTSTVNRGSLGSEDVNTLSEDSADAMNEIIMAIDMRDRGPHGSTIGCAYYVVLEEALYLLEDVAMAGVDLVETLLLHAQPTTVLISTRAPESLDTVLARGSQDVNGNRGDIPGAYILRNLNSVDFRYDIGKNRLLDLHLGTDGPSGMLYTTVVDNTMLETDGHRHEGSKQGQLMRLATRINLDSQLTIGCAGAVLGDIQRRKTAQYLPNDPDALVAFRIRTVEMFSLFDSMFVNADTFMSLQIMQPEYHPNRLQRGPTGTSSGAKEGLSIYGLFSHLAATPQGKTKLRRIFLQPSTNLDIIRERQSTISFLLRPSNADALSSISRDLRKIKDMNPLMLLLRKGIDSIGRKVSVANSVWAALQRFAAYSLQLRESLRALPGTDKIDIVNKTVQRIDILEIRQIGELITETIDFEQSVERGRTAVKQGVDANLDELKRSYDGMEHFLSSVITKLRGGIPEWAREYVQNCIFFPQLGFLTVISINQRTGKGDYDGEGLPDRWECMFVADSSAYYKNQQMKEMDEKFGDSYCMIIDREIEIIHQLTVTVLGREAAIIAASEVLGELDSLVALATLCGQNKWTAPIMTNLNVLRIKGGRHPLQELVTSAFIPNDCSIAGGAGSQMQGDIDMSLSESPDGLQDSPSTVVITGPNHSGKSVYLKQIAIIVYLAHIGCFVPADHAYVGLTDRILTRIATRESVARYESAFAIDLRQVAFTVNFATRRSLIIVDEFGKGTNTQDGAGLLAATIDHFTNLHLERPKLLVATHFHEILDSELLTESAELAYAHMKILLDLEAPTIEDQVTYLYQLAPGKSISSFGSRCAAMNGVNQAIVERAESIILQMMHHEDLEAACSKLSKTETQKLATAEAVARAFLQEDLTRPPVRDSTFRVEAWYRSKLNKILLPDIS